MLQYFKYILKRMVLASVGIPCGALDSFGGSSEEDSAEESGNTGEEPGEEGEDPEGGGEEAGGTDFTPSQEVLDAFQLLEDKVYYSALTSREAAQVAQYVWADLAALETLEARGWTLEQSRSYAQAVKRSGKDLDSLLAAFPTADEIQRLVGELVDCDIYFSRAAYTDDLRQRFLDYIFGGKTAEQTLWVYSIGQATGLQMDALFSVENQSCTSADALEQKVYDYAHNVGINGETLYRYTLEQGLSQEQLEEIVEEAISTACLPPSLIAPLAVSSGSPGSAVPTPEEEKQYNEAPFVYNYQDRENISLNSGALEYRSPDFVLPGRNGLDLEITRRYDSQSSNAYDFNYTSEKRTMYYYVIYQSYKGGTKEIVNWLGFFDDASTRREYCMEEYYAVKDYVESSYKITYTVPSVTTYNYTTDTRQNTHLTKNYGLGLGWSFQLPSIEKVSDTDKKDRVTYTDYLHLGDGSSYKINFTTTTNASNLVNYKLTDIQFIKQSGTVTLSTGGTAAYDHYLSYKDGKKHYFSSNKLVVTQDRFGNTMKYSFNDNGGATIVDTLGRTIRLTKSGSGSSYTLTWTLPDNSTIVYTIASNRLTSYKDQEGRVTTYGYTNQSASARLFDNISGDPGASITYTHLTSVKYPTNAQTIYTYTRLSRTLNTTYGRYQQFYGVNSRKEIPDSSQPSVVKDPQSFAYTMSGRYLTRATATKSDSVVSTHTFNTDGLQTAETVAHGGKTVSSTAYTYNTYRLPSRQVITTYNQSSQSIQRVYSWTYDIKGNVLTETDPLSNVTTNTYQATYYLPTSKVYKKDSATTITEEYTLHTPANGSMILPDGCSENTTRWGMLFGRSTTPWATRWRLPMSRAARPRFPTPPPIPMTRWAGC